MMIDEEGMRRIKEIVLKEKKIANEFISLSNYLKNTDDIHEKKIINNQIERLKSSLKKTNEELLKDLEEIIIRRSLEGAAILREKVAVKEPIIPEEKIPAVPEKKRKIKFHFKRKEISGLSELDREILKRLKKKKKEITEKKEKGPSSYVKIANNFFSGFVKSLIKEKKFAALKRDLIKSNLGYTPMTYVSIMIFTIILSIIISVFAFIFFLFFSISPELPIIIRATEAFGARLLKTFWIILAVPAGTLIFMYFYPYLERKSIEGKIDQELPFATIHMAAISGSMVEPTKIFSIICSTEDYPNLEKEFNKLLNEINIYGYDLVTALKELAINCPSQKLGELFNGLATTITSGGDLYDFFDKRANSMLFEYRLNKEKRTKTAETFMDIYISVVIAAPMILMLLLMMMKISGFGVGMSTSLITILVTGGVSVINVVFLIFSQLKQTTV